MYKYSMTCKEELDLTQGSMFEHKTSEPNVIALSDGKKIKNLTDVSGLKEYFSKEETETMRKQEEYLSSGPGRLQSILDSEMERLHEFMDEKMKAQDEEFLVKAGVKK